MKKQRPTMRTWKPTAEDEKLVQELRQATGVQNVSDIVRMGLRALRSKTQAEAEQSKAAD